MSIRKADRVRPRPQIASLLRRGRVGEEFLQSGHPPELSQATVSLRIKNLETAVGQPLFERSYHVVELSLKGQDLLPHAQLIVDQHDALIDKLKGGTVSGTVNLGIAEDYGQAFLSRLMRVVAASFPQIELSVTCQMSVRLQKLLDARNLDLAIVTLPDQNGRATILSRPKLVWVASPDYVADPSRPWPMAFYLEGCAFRAEAEAALRRAGQAYREVLTTASGEAIKSAVSSATAITVMAEGTIPDGYRILNGNTGLPALPHSFIQLVEREDGLSKAAKQVRNSVLKMLGSD